jgi:tetratricopeptide (TPR) repeat protein
LLLFRMQISQAIVASQEAIAQAQRAQERDGEAAGQLTWGYAAWLLGNYPTARQRLEQCLALSRAAPFYHAPTPGRGMAITQAMALNVLAMISVAQRQYDAAAAYEDETFGLYAQVGDWWGMARARWWLAHAYYRVGSYVRAAAYYRQTLRAAHDVGSRQYVHDCVLRLGRIALCLGTYDAAQAHAEQAWAWARASRHRASESAAVAILSEVAYHRRAYAQAWDYSQQALHQALETGDQHLQAHSLFCGGQALAALGRLAAAQGAYQEALQLHMASGARHLALACRAGLAQVALLAGNGTLAQTHVEEILPALDADALDGVEDPLQIYLTCFQVLDANRDTRARSVLSRAHRLLEELVAQIGDEALRRAFLENVAAHSVILRTGTAQVANEYLGG